MGFIAAFNIAAIQRLKHSKALLKKKTLAVRFVGCSSSVLLTVVQVLQELEALMNPSSSWGTYRHEVANARLPCVPYMYV